MLIRKAYKFRLEPTAEQAARLVVLCGHARFVWNQGLRHCLEKLDEGEKIPSYAELCKTLTQWKKNEDLSWLKEAYTDNLQQKLKDLHGAWIRCFDKSLTADKPRFKKKGKNQDSIRFVNFNKYCQIDGKRVKLPSKLGWLKFRKSQEVQGNIKNCTISFKSGHWYVSFQVEQEIDEPMHASCSAVGIDMGVAKFATLSDGSYLNPLNIFRKHEKRLAVEQRKLSRKVKFSANWQKQKARIQKLHTLIANCRKDYLHKASHQISKNHAMIVIEDLRVSNMSKSAKGNAEEYGKNVKAKSGLNKSILDQGWYEFRRQLEYKQLWNGGLVVAVPAQYTSQTCPCCGHVSKDNRRAQSHFECIECGYTNNADIVGALNVLERGHRLLACGETALAA
ncbi:transposase [Vibrio parahaemolyticus]|nr:transposase [Vibrio parahaemolyticus]EJG0231852.1 transposase [Vibrio parahaemolyticus]EJG0250897.1 transposase [Vibrio parahaemolyticus]EJG0388862.1 transposase [Vibrio parahaemolyticus]